MIQYNQQEGKNLLKIERLINVNAYTVEVMFTQYGHTRTKKYFVGAKNMDAAKMAVVREFWDDYGEKPNVRIFSFTVNEYN